MQVRHLSKIALLALLPWAASAQASEKLAEQKQCLQCHHLSEAKIGPSFQQISRKYKGKNDGVKNVTAIVRKGSRATGGPHWGKATMPDNAERPEVSAAEARQMAAWILQQ